MELECARDCCNVDIRVYIRVNSPLSYTWRVDSYIFLLFLTQFGSFLFIRVKYSLELSSVHTIFILLTMPNL